MEIEGKWETIESDVVRCLEKIRVHGGWLFRSSTVVTSGSGDGLVVGCSESMAFVPEGV